MKKIILLYVALLVFTNVKASHFMGGEITWVCIKDASDPNVGKYIFTLKIYQDCDGINFPFTNVSLTVHNNPSLANIQVNFLDTNDISASGVAGSIPCYDCGNQPAGQVGAIKEWIYVSDPIIIPGTPPANGWHFTWGTCCRSAAITNILNPSGADWTLRAVMYPYIGPSGSIFPNGNICHDSSPIFKEQAKSILCTGYPFSYSHLAFDVELDSLSYSWAEPLEDNFAYDPNNPSSIALAFVPPYLFNSPIPGNPTLNSVNGEISFNSNTSGFFVTAVKVSAFKCDQIVAEVFREVQVILQSCGNLPNGQANSPPVITPPVGAQSWITTINPSTGLPSYETTVSAGETIDFSITASDADININNVLQTISLDVEGGQLDSTYSLGGRADFNVTGSSPGNVSGEFNWVTDCSHTAASLDSNCQRTTNLFTFNLKAYDDFCPANGTVIATISIYIEPQLIQPPPDFKCVVKDKNSDVTVTWGHLPDAGSSTNYYVYGAENIGGPYNLIGSQSFPNTSFTFSSVSSNIDYFYMKLESLCADASFPSDTIMLIELDISSSNVSCWNDSDGRIAIDMTSNVITPFTYILDNVPNPLPYPGDSIFSGLSAGTYSLTITDSASCYINNMITITAPNSPLQALTSGDLGLCHSDSTSISVAYAAGGTAPYSYSWYSSTVGSPSTIISTTDTAFGLTSGVYFAEVTDANGCDTVSSVQVLTPNTSLFSSTQISELICKGDSSGYLVGDAGGGFAPYTYEWSTSLSGIIKTTSGVYNTDTLRNLSADIYLLDITDHFGCKVSQISLTVNEPSQALFLDTIYLIDSIACFGDNDGRALGVVSGGDPFYTYLWDNGESTLLANHLTSGYHTLSVIDYRGCEVLDSIYIPESSEIISSLVVDEMISCYSSVNGVVSVSTVGGHPRYTYSWSNNQPLYTGIVDTAFALSYGVYALTTEDTLGCSVVDSVYLAEPALLTMQAQELSRVSCKGLSDGLAFSTAHGGTLPYTFVWGNSQTGDTVNTLSSGLYTVIVTDARGCIASDTVFIHEPLNSLMVDISVLDFVYCNGVSTGILEANVLGGTPFMGTSSSYTYLWDDALQASQTTAVAINLSEDIYTVIVTDSRGCTATDTEDITNVTNTMILDSAYSDVSCYGSADGSASVFASGGHAPYSYSWVGPSGISLGNVDVINNLSAGTYSVTVSDINNCTRNTSVDIIEPLGILFNISNSSDESCAGACDGLIHIDSLSGGTFPYTALLTNTLNGVVTQHPVQLGNILFVCSAEYTVSLTDDNGCESSVLANNQAIVNSLNVLPTPSISLLNSISCFGASTGELAVSLVDPNYTYLWESLSDPTFNSSSNTISNLSSGDYLVTVQYTDSLGQILTGCDVASLPYTLDDGSEIIITETLHTDVLCHGDNTGAISIFPSPVNTGPYTYAWDPVSLTGATNINLSAGVYSVTVMDNNNCEKSAVFTINEPLVELEVGIDSVGYVLTANPLGGTLPYSYSWRAQGSNVSLQAGVTYNIYSAGTYYVRVTDSNGCVVESDSIKYNTPPPPPPPTSIDETSKEVVLSIYPNPFNDQTTVSFGREVKLASIRVVDVFGKLIEEYKVVNSDKHILKRENKSSGIYFVEIEVEQKGKSIYKLIIE